VPTVVCCYLKSDQKWCAAANDAKCQKRDSAHTLLEARGSIPLRTLCALFLTALVTKIWREFQIPLRLQRRL
jgi:hypothetical protein